MTEKTGSSEQDVDIVDHQDIFVSPMRNGTQSPVRVSLSVDIVSPSKRVRPRSPRRSQTVDVIKMEDETRGQKLQFTGSKNASTDDLVADLAPLDSPRRKLVFSTEESPRKKKKASAKPRNTLLDDFVNEDLQDIQDYKHMKLNLNPDFKPTPVPKSDEMAGKANDQTQIYFFDGFEGYIDQTKILRTENRSKSSMSSAPSITRDEYNIISQLTNDLFHRSSIKAVQTIHERLFQQFTFELLQGFTLLFYGIGSKRKFLERFVFEFLSMKIALLQNPDIGRGDGCIPVFVINGYNTVSKNVFLDIFKVLTEGETIDNSVGSNYWDNRVDLQMARLLKYFKSRPPTVKMILLIHNLDGPSFRREQFQTRISILAQIKQICIVSSVDHIQAPLLWDHFKAQSFNFVYHDITNFEPYIVETIQTRNAIDLANDSSTLFNAVGAKYVLESLTDNAKRMYKILLRLLTSKAKGNQPGIEFQKLFKACTEQFVVSNEMALRLMLSEFIDHKMASVSKNKMGKEVIDVKYSPGDIEKLIGEIDSMIN